MGGKVGENKGPSLNFKHAVPEGKLVDVDYLVIYFEFSRSMIFVFFFPSVFFFFARTILM